MYCVIYVMLYVVDLIGLLGINHIKKKPTHQETCPIGWWGNSLNITHRETSSFLECNAFYIIEYKYNIYNIFRI